MERLLEWAVVLLYGTLRFWDGIWIECFLAAVVSLGAGDVMHWRRLEKRVLVLREATEEAEN
ncbi:MAG: hypothetical protein ACI9DF_002717 [Verrucomicrobiales bacterium]|jgi:hypothetical protein